MIRSFRQLFFVFRLVYKADPYRLPFCFLYHLWVTFVNLVFLTLLPRWLIVAYEQKISWFRVLAVLLLLWISQIGYSLYSNYYNQIIKPVSDERIYHFIQKDIFFNSLSVPFFRLDEPEYYNDFMKAGREAKSRITSVMDQTFGLILDFISLFILLYVMARIHICFVFLALLAFFLPILWKSRLNQLIFHGDMEALNEERKAVYVNRAFFLKQYSREIKISNISKVLLKQFSDAMKGLREIRKQYGLKITLLQMLSFFFHDILCYALFVLLAVYLLYHRSVLLGDFVLAITSLSVLTDRMNFCLNGFFTLRNAGNYLDNLKVFLSPESCLPEKRHQESFQKDSGQTQKITPFFPGGEHQKTEFSSLKLCGLTFRYNGCSQYALKGISLTIHKGQHIALIGENGAGKSTLIKLLLGLYMPQSGKILFNDHSLLDCHITAYRKLFSVIFQDFSFFSAGIAQNIVLDLQWDKSELDDALEQSLYRKDPYLNKIPLDTCMTKEFDEDGIVLSGGQAQKLVITRAFLKSPFVLMDEPSSELDAASEQKLNELILRNSMKKGVLIISHRLTTTRQADRILVLSHGKKVEEGSHTELMQRKGHYYHMFMTQANQYQ